MENYFETVYLTRLNKLKEEIHSIDPERGRKAIDKSLEHFFKANFIQTQDMKLNRVQRLVLTYGFLKAYLLNEITDEEYLASLKSKG